MIAAVIKGNLPLAGKMMQADRFHENYREKSIPHLSTIRQICEEEGGYGCFLSGAGPTVLAIVPPERQIRSAAFSMRLKPMQQSNSCRSIAKASKSFRLF